jgi:hypothetical protein
MTHRTLTMTNLLNLTHTTLETAVLQIRFDWRSARIARRVSQSPSQLAGSLLNIAEQIGI